MSGSVPTIGHPDRRLTKSLAYFREGLPVLDVLVASGANAAAPDGEGKSALMHACEAGHAPVAEHLAEHQNGSIWAKTGQSDRKY